MDIKKSFETEFSKEILQSEKFRGLLLSGIIVVMLLAIAVNAYYLKVFENNLIKPFQWFIVILIALLIRSILVRKFQVVWFKKSRKKYLTFLYINTFIETSIPSVVIIVFASQFNPATALISPIVFFYFIFIILSIFDLDLKLSIFAGCVASAEYLILALIYYDLYTFSGNLAILNIYPLYAAKSLFLLMAGVIAGIVSLKIRKNIFSSFHTLQERNNLEKAFGQQVSKEVVDEFIQNNLTITSREREATIMFLDIRDFSNFCEGKTPEEINQITSTERKKATRSAFKEGFIDELMTLAEQGDTQAMIHLGVYYESEGDSALAHAWLRHAEDQGDKYSGQANRWREIVEGKRRLRLRARANNKKQSGDPWKKRMTPEEEADSDLYYHIISKENSAQD